MQITHPFASKSLYATGLLLVAVSDTIVIGVELDQHGEQAMDIGEIKTRIRTDQYVYTLHAEIERKADNMKKVRCNFCGSDQFEERRIEYLYSHRGEYLLVPNTPVEICLNCGMVYYDAKILKEIERRFFAIQNKAEKPDRYIEIPEKAYAA